MLAVGALAPPFSGRDQHGREVRSDDLLRKGPVVLYFYPRDFTPGCTREACLFRDAHDDLAGLGATVVGVSVDDEARHREFADAHRLPFPLLSDPDRALAKAYGVARPLFLGTRRATFVIDRGGTIRAVIHQELSMSAHVRGVQAALEALGPG